MNTNLSNGTVEEEDLPHPLEFIAAEEKFRRSGGYDYGKVFSSRRELKLIKAAYNLGRERYNGSLGSTVSKTYEKAGLDEPDWINKSLIEICTNVQEKIKGLGIDPNFDYMTTARAQERELKLIKAAYTLGRADESENEQPYPEGNSHRVYVEAGLEELK